MKNILISSLVVYTFIISNVFSIEENNKECTGNQLEINYCAADRFKHYDKILNDLYKEQVDYLESDGYKRLKKSQQQWIKFRDADCLYQAEPWKGGSGWAAVHWECMAEQTKIRAIQLEKYVKCRENGCPN